MKRIIFSLSFILCQWLACAAQQSDYKMAGPYEVVARDGQYRSSKGGFFILFKNQAIVLLQTWNKKREEGMHPSSSHQ